MHSGPWRTFRPVRRRDLTALEAFTVEWVEVSPEAVEAVALAGGGDGG